MKTRIRRFSSSVDTYADDINDVIDDAVKNLSLFAGRTYNEDTTTDANFIDRRLAAWLTIWELNQDVTQNSFDSIRLNLVELIRSKNIEDPYWNKFIKELSKYGLELTIDPDWPMRLGTAYDDQRDDLEVTRTTPNRWG